MNYQHAGKRALVLAMLSVAVLIFLPYAYSEGKNRGKDEVPPGFSKGEKKGWKEGRPPGWTEGEKKGWQSALPPGLEEGAGEKGRQAFQAKLSAAEEAIREKARGKRLGKEITEDILVSFNLGTRNGAPVNETAEVVGAMVDYDHEPDDVARTTRALAYGASREVDLSGMGGYVKALVQAGLRGDDLSLAVYEEIERRRQAQIGAPQKEGE